MCGTGLHCIKPDIGQNRQNPEVVAPAVGDIAVYCPGSVFLSGLLQFQPGFVTWTDIELPAELHADNCLCPQLPASSLVPRPADWHTIGL